MSLFTFDKNSILQETKWLQPLSDPPGGRPLFRDADLELMGRRLSGLFTAGQASNLFIYGTPGTGKTVCVKYMLKEVAKHASEAKLPIQTAYVNAGKTRNPYYTMQEIVRQLGVSVPCAGWQMSRLKQAFESILAEKSVLIAIDEVDCIIFKEKEPLVYYLSRQPKTTLILISNDIDDIVKLPEKTLSTLHPVMIDAEPYAPEEIKQILKERADRTFKPNTISSILLTKIAQTVSEAGDIRLGFRILLTAGLYAEKAGKQVIDAADVAAAIRQESNVKRVREIEDLRDKFLKLKKQYDRR
jgi:cell division control protein 6